MAELNRQLWLNSTSSYGWIQLAAMAGLSQQLWLDLTGSYG